VEVIARVVDYLYYPSIIMLVKSLFILLCSHSAAFLWKNLFLCSNALPYHSLPLLLTGDISSLASGVPYQLSAGVLDAILSFSYQSCFLGEALHSSSSVPARHFWCHAQAAKANVQIHTEGSWFWPTINKHPIMSTNGSRLQTSCQTSKRWYRICSKPS
jgi:hypothetical protein